MESVAPKTRRRFSAPEKLRRVAGARIRPRRPSCAAPLTIPGVTGAVQLAVNEDAACARLTDGTRACWGLELAGEFGDGPTVSTSTSGVSIPTPDAITDISSGG